MLINKIEEPPNTTAIFMPKKRKQPMVDKRRSICKSMALSNKAAPNNTSLLPDRKNTLESSPTLIGVNNPMPIPPR